jgi:uncharacterized protein YjbJ (UPF0337 family)
VILTPLASHLHLNSVAKHLGGIVNWDQIEGKWKQLKGSVRQQWGKLTDNDLERIAGKRDSLVGKLQEYYGLAKQEAQARVDEWAHALHDEEQARKSTAPAGDTKSIAGKP